MSSEKESSSRRERAKADKRRRILEASKKLFTTNGFEGTTVQQIADESDIAVGTLFLYVRDKSELLILLFSDRLEELVAASQEHLFARRTLRPALLSFFDGFLRLYEEDLTLSRLFWREFLVARPESRAGLDRLTGILIAALMARLARAQTEGEIGLHVDPQVAALHLYALFHATVSFHVVECTPESTSHETLARLLKSFWNGLKP